MPPVMMICGKALLFRFINAHEDIATFSIKSRRLI